jgi:hypothetical protein
MSQSSVERIIGVLVTDEAVRRRFVDDPVATLEDLVRSGNGLNECERRALASLDPGRLARFADAIDARLQKTDLKRETRDASPPLRRAPGNHIQRDDL